MIKKIGLLCCSLLLVLGLSAQDNTASRLAYVEKYKDIAIKEMKRAGIPASIKLAQGILESSAGKSKLARRANNHFGIKCGGDWSGKTYSKEDDEFNDEGEIIESCFRVYTSPEASFIAHSEFLRNPRKAYRYGFLFYLDPTDYRSWAQGLKSAGYATNPHYADILIRLIETYQLSKYDKYADEEIVDIEDPDDPDSPKGPGMDYIVLVNDVKMVFAQQGDTPQSIASRSNTPVKCILKYNEQVSSPNQSLKSNERVYLQKKRSNYREKTTWHYVNQGESMYQIAQLYGIRLNKLYKRNRMVEGREPALGERIKLRGKVGPDGRPKYREEVDDASAPEPPISDLPGDEEHTTPDDEIDLLEDDPDLEPDPAPEPEPEPTPEPDPAPDPEPEPTPKPEPNLDDLPEPPFGEPDFEEPTPEPTPQPQPQPTPPPPPVDPSPSPSNGFHLVVKGDTLYSLARRYGTTVDGLRRLNGLSDNIIKIGQQLRVR